MFELSQKNLQIERKLTQYFFNTLIVNTIPYNFVYRMITDVQLAIFSNILGVFLFLLVVAYHYINANIGK